MAEPEVINIIIEESPAEIVTIAVSEVNGDAGYTPIKGIDYFDGKDGVTPVKGIDYFDGKDGVTPVKGIDYFDGISAPAETQSSLINKIGYATDTSAGLLSPEDHLLFKNKQPAGQYVTAVPGSSLMTTEEHRQLAILYNKYLHP